MKTRTVVVGLALTAALVFSSPSLQVHGQGLGSIATSPPPVFERAANEPSFEVISVKKSDPAGDTGPLAALGQFPLIMPPVGGQFRATNVTLRLLLRTAYSLQDFHLIGGPVWQNTEKFTITATAGSGFQGGMPEVLPMIRSLLAERFKLKTHKETREVPVYALTLARSDGRLGPKMKPSTSDCSNAAAEQQKLAEAASRGDTSVLAGLLSGNVKCAMMPMMPGMGRGAAGANPQQMLAGFGLKADGQPMSVLVELLQQTMGRTVLDKTGLKGLYDWEVTFNPEALMRMVSQIGINLPPEALQIFGQIDSPPLPAAIQQDLGLKLESQRGPGDVLVIDSAEMPAAD